MFRKGRWLFGICLAASLTAHGQLPEPSDTTLPIPPLHVRMKNWGPNDTLLVPALWYRNEMHTYREQDGVWIGRGNDRERAKQIKEWTRLRNAVYVTYPYARIAGATINDIAKNLEPLSERRARKKYLESREKQLRKEFADPLTNLSVYQGKILMKLINRQTGNNCYDILKEYKGGMNARLYQTVAFFFGGNLKQDWSPENNSTDRDIENIIREIDGAWYNNPQRR
ncbi:MAG: hypothetical protein RLZZ256_786 [Bacteroidota bacterium]|jgi:hypothetical protein